jgi:hypothetical protein
VDTPFVQAVLQDPERRAERFGREEIHCYLFRRGYGGPRAPPSVMMMRLVRRGAVWSSPA